MHAKDRTLIASLAFADPDKKNSRHDLACQYVAQPAITKKLVETFVPLTSTSLGQFGGGVRLGSGEVGYSPSRVTWKYFRSCYTERGKAEAPALEVPISKGEGQYRTTIGFVDVHIPFVIERLTRGESLLEWKMFRDQVSGGACEPYNQVVVEPQISDPKGATPFEDVTSFIGDIFIEVKIAKESFGNILRQINLYKEYRQFICARVHNPRMWSNKHLALDGSWCGNRTTWILVTDFLLSEAEAASLEGEGIKHVTLGEDFETFLKDTASSQPSKSLSI